MKNGAAEEGAAADGEKREKRRRGRDRQTKRVDDGIRVK